MGEFSGLLSPYNGCSLHNYHTGHSEHEAYTVYLQCYTEQVIVPGFVSWACSARLGVNGLR